MKTGQKLLIVESPAKIKTISKFLGKDFKIVSTFGHVKDLPSKKLGIEIKANKIILDYVPIKDKAKVIKDIVALAKKCDEVYLASDPDREGEIISWHIGKEIEKAVKGIKIHRITFNEITKDAVLKAIENKSKINIKQVNAQQARRVLDRWVGYEVSPILWRKIRKGLSAGRVQSAALRVVCDREEEISNFKPEEYWSIHGIFKKTKEDFIAELAKINNKAFKLKSQKETDKLVDDLKKQSYKVKDISVKQRKKKPLPPFMTSTLQQDAFNKLGFSVKRTMDVAQKLYEGMPLNDSSSPEALITYMRTDSLRLSDTALKQSRGYIKSNFGNDYLPKSTKVYSKASAQDAHEAIRPINFGVTPDIATRYLPRDAAKLYGLIWKRTLASQMTDAEYQQRQVNIEGGKYLFRITGSTLIFDGFLKVYLIEDDDKKVVKIPKEITKGCALNLEKIDPKQHFTQPPPRYSEASLVKELEKLGIGRPSTYGTILVTIQKRDYTNVEKKRFIPTELGKAVNTMLVANLPDLMNLDFTALMEEYLDKISSGEIKRDDVLLGFYKQFQENLKKFAGTTQKKEVKATDYDCPKCKKNKLAIRFGSSGDFLGCLGFPDCDFTANFKKKEDGTLEILEPEKPQVSEIKCPKCGKNLVQKKGRFGPFLACPGFPDCKYIHQEKLKMKCPLCKKDILKRVSARGSFWGCSGYPKCRFAIFGNPIEKECPKCKAPYLVEVKDKNEKVLHKCNSKECDYVKEIK